MSEKMERKIVQLAVVPASKDYPDPGLVGLGNDGVVYTAQHGKWKRLVCALESGTTPNTSTEMDALRKEVADLELWKRQATEIIDGWMKVWAEAGKPEFPGEPFYYSMLKWVREQRKKMESCDELATD